MTAAPAEAPAPLRGRIGPLKFFSLGFGSILGSSWVLLLGGWLSTAGIGGTLVGLLAGTAAMALLGLCYAELAARLPEAGAELIYALNGIGPRTAFAVSWILMLYLVGVTVFEGIAFGAMVRRLAPWIAGPTLYHVLGAPITLDAIVLGVAGALAILVLNLRGGTQSSTVHGWLTYGFIAIAVAALGYMALFARVQNFRPFWTTPTGGPWGPGALSVLTTSCFLLTGFQTIPQAIEERAPTVSLRTIAIILVSTILAASLVYVGVVLCASGVAPWRQLAGSDGAVIEAALHTPLGGGLALVLLAATCVSIVKTWNGVAFTAGRLIMAQARHGFLPNSLARLNAAGTTPRTAFLLLGGINVAGVFLGKGALLPIVDTSALGICLISVVCCIALLRLRRGGGSAPFEAPGGTVTIVAAGLLMSGMGLVAFLQPLAAGPGVPIEWILLAVWASLGVLVWGDPCRSEPLDLKLNNEDETMSGNAIATADEVTSPSRIECGMAVVHPWLCDIMGHLTTRHYMAMFDDSNYQFLALIGYDAHAALAEHWGWADVRHEINYLSELPAGAILRIDGRAIACGRTSITVEFRLIDRSDERVCATLEAKMVCFDLEARKSRPLPPAIVAAVESLFGLSPPA